MRRFLISVIFFILATHVQAQKSVQNSVKYPSLLWEISGNGLKKPSYLFGTMHVSNKMVFHLSDSFYQAIRSADVVALETNPESWQEDMFNFNLKNSFDERGLNRSSASHTPEDYLTINMLKVDKFDYLLRAALAGQPSTINNLLYRTYSERGSDFEEDTYLDLYIYQVGKKWGKKIVGVEHYEESMRLMFEAYLDAMKDKNRKERMFELDDDFSPDKLQEAYRTGNLDLLDTINRVNSFSSAFDEKFLFRRNEIQAASIDSIIKNGQTLFVGVGAAHLPGDRGIIEILRRQGYKLRPIRMGERDSRHKEAVENVFVPLKFQTHTAEDGFYKVSVPGKLYRFSSFHGGFDQQQFADMANGSYYIVTRIQTAGLLQGLGADAVLKKVDSLLYENIPGKILAKQVVNRNGYKGFSIVNKTRRGDYQRCHIYVSPFEVLVFKVSGTGDYIKESDVADRFFNSIELKTIVPSWTKYAPSSGGFEVAMPHEPLVNRNKNWVYQAYDKVIQADFTIIKSSLHNYSFAGEDSFDLSLMEESFTSSDFYDRTLSRKKVVYNGYPSLEAKYAHKDGSVSLVRYLIQGPHYYTVIAHGKTVNSRFTEFINSFKITPFVYGTAKTYTDTALYFKVHTPYFEEKKKTLELPSGFENVYLRSGEERSSDMMESGVFRDRVISNDTTGEKIYISFFKSPKYYYAKDSSSIKEFDRYLKSADVSWILKLRKDSVQNGTRVLEYLVTDTGSSRAIWTKTFYRDGVRYSLKTQIDTLSPASSFITGFYNSFSPSDTVKGYPASKKKGEIYFTDFFSADSVTRLKAIGSISLLAVDSSDIQPLKRATESLSWKDANYLTVKKDFIEKFGSLPTKEASDYLKKLYYAAGDTVELQYSVLQNLVAQQTAYSFRIVKDILLNDPPVLDIGSSFEDEYDVSSDLFMEGLYDSLKLTASIFPDLLPLIIIDDYKQPMMHLMGTLVDSGLLAAKDYAAYQSKFLIEAKQAWKKQAIAEKKRSIEKAQKTESSFRRDVLDEEGSGNKNLELYATLLMPFWNTNASVPTLLNQFFTSSDNVLKYNAALLFLRNGKQLPDTILNYFAANDYFRYNLYTDLHKINKAHLFPAHFKNQQELAKSKLYNELEDGIPDSLLFISKLEAEVKGQKGYVHFFKYKRKKDDLTWKIAAVGMSPADTSRFEFTDRKGEVDDDFDLTKVTDVKLNEDSPVADQLNKILKQLVYSKKNSGRYFYKDSYEVNMRSTFRSIR